MKAFEVWKHPENARLFKSFAEKVGLKQPSVPVTVVGNAVISGFSEVEAAKIEEKVREAFLNSGESEDKAPGPAGSVEPPDRAGPVSQKAPQKAPVEEIPAESAGGAPAVSDKQENADSSEAEVVLPFVGTVRTEDFSLPVFTLVLAGLDSFNPCALYVLMFLLSLLIHAKSRARMLIVGGTFVFFSGFVYFLFMAAWLNLFFLVGRVVYMTIAAGTVALFVGAINVKDFFAFKEGVSLTMSNEAQGRLIARMRGLLKEDCMCSMLAGTVLLALVANAYELLCTAGFPMVYTRVLTLRELGTFSYYSYLMFYNVVYIVPLAAMVLIFTFTLGSRKLTQWEGRLLKLLSGSMMLMLGVVLLLKPRLLENVLAATGMLFGALVLTWVFAQIWKRWGRSGGPGRA